MREYTQRNRERIKASRKERRESINAYQRKWKAANRDKARTNARTDYEKNRERYIARALQWKADNPEAARASSLKHARLRYVEKNTDDYEYVEILLRDPCAYYGAPMEEIDHIVSIHASGANEWENLTAACMNCNRSKRERDLLDFLRERLRRSIRDTVGTP